MSAVVPDPAERPEKSLPANERAMLAAFDAQRRLQLLRLIVPGLLVVALAAVPFAIQADMASLSFQSSLQVGVGLVAFAVALWATRTRRVNLASFAAFAGVTGVIVLLLLYDGPLGGGGLDLTAMPAFALLIIPISLAGLLGGPRFAAAATAIAVLFSLLTILLTPHTPGLARALDEPDGLALFTLPLSAQLALGLLTVAATRGYRRTQRELGDVRIAYAREKELDRLKDQFISSVNHELRTPIMALQGYIELARELGARGDDDRQARMLERGAETTAHLAGLVTSVLNIRTIEADAASLNLAPVALRATILAATRLLDPRDAAGHERELRLDVPADLAVFADEDRVRQVVLNLLSNAIKYSPEGSPIEISARLGRSRAAGRRRAPEEEGTVRVAVRDHGLGIPPEQAVLLFQRFVRLERDIASQVTGTGLGLAICRAYVEAMGGRIWVESSGVPGEGSTFIFTLPLAHAVPISARLDDAAAAHVGDRGEG